MTMSTQVAAGTGFSSDSAYAAWSADERSAADRAEVRFNADQRRHLAGQVSTAYVRVAADDNLRNLARTCRRQLEDIASGDLSGGEPRARLICAMLTDIEREQECRQALAQSWLAREDGTHCYSAYEARGGLGAVLRHGAVPPTYHLAAILDRLNWQRGLPHVLAWAA